MLNSSINISGLVIAMSSSKKARYYDIECPISKDGTILVRIKLPVETGKDLSDTGRILTVNDGRLYKSKDSSKTAFAVSATQATASKGFYGNSVSLIGDVVSNIKTTKDTAEFMMTDLSVPKDLQLNIHVICENPGEKFHIKKGDKVAIIGGHVDIIRSDKNSDFVIRTSPNRLHPIPFFDGEEDAATL